MMRRAADTPLAALGVAFALAAPAAAAPERLAVVVGNQDYGRITDLANARGDTARMAEMLRGMGFTVFDGYDVTRAGFEALMRSSILNADAGSEIVFFYAGHGIQIGRRNYLLPTDVAFESVYDLPVESITLDRVIEVLSAKGTVHVAIIDACRENPFPDAQLAGDLDASLFETRQGFDVFQTPLNSLVAFSTTPGMVAYDGAEGGHSPYTAAILETVQATPRENVTDLFAQVREQVYDATSGRQVPWESSTLVRPFRFVAVESEGDVPLTAQAADDSAVGQERQDTPLPEAVTLSVAYDRTIPLADALADALGRAALPPLTLAAPASRGTVTTGADLAYAPTLEERRAEGEALTLTDSFTLESGAGPLDVTLEMEANACDLAAGDALDPGGVGLYRLPNEIPVERARAACAAALEAEPGEARFRYQLGRAQQAAGDYEAAFANFEQAAEAGHVRALNATARLLTAPQVDRALFDVPRDRARAFDLLERGVAAADPFAMHLLGRFLLRDGEAKAERERGFELLDRAAELGHTYSMNELGIYFLTQDSDHFIPERGMTYLRASAAREDIYGYHNLGFVALYALTGGEPDYAAAHDWFVRAAEGGHPGSPATLGRMVVRGQVPGATAADALRWYDLGLERGDPWGGVNAANMILNGEVPGPSDAEALVRAAKALHVAEDEPADRARAMLQSAGPRDLARATQHLLNELGADLVVDGLIGPATRGAIEARAREAGVAVPADERLAQLLAMARVYWAENPVRSDVF